jgi:hypothetical protein
MRYAGLQEASGLAEGALSYARCRSRQQENSRIPVRVAPESDLPRGGFDSRKHRRRAKTKSQKDFGRFLGIALNSSSELEYHLILARDTNNMPEKEFLSLVGQTITVRKMLYALLKRVAEAEAPTATGDAPDQRTKPPAAPPKAGSQNSKPPAAPPTAAGG